jgi:hypothetical protein
VRAEAGTAQAQAEARPSPAVPARADLELREPGAAERTPAAAGRPAGTTAAPAPAPGGGASFAVTARDAGGRPLPGATVRIGPLPAVATDAQGRARAAMLAAGEYPVVLAHPTLGTLTGRVTVPASVGGIEIRPAGGAGSTSLTVVANRLVALEGVEARSEARLRGLDIQGFYARRARGIGVFLTDSAIQTSPTRRLTSVLRGVPGVQLVRNVRPDAIPGAEINEPYRVASGRIARRLCFMDVYLDGLPVQTRANLQDGPNLDDVSLHDVQAVEVYRGPGEIPPEYRGGGSPCGVVLLWTRR